MCDSCDVRSSPPRAQSREPVYLISARMALGIWGLEPRGSLQRPEVERGAQVSLPPSEPFLAQEMSSPIPSHGAGYPCGRKAQAAGSTTHPTYKIWDGGHGWGRQFRCTQLWGVQLRERCTPSSLLVPTWGTAEPPRGLSPECPSQHHTRHVPAECSGVPGALTTCLLLQGILHHHGQVDNQHQGLRELVELGAERVHPHPLCCHCGSLHQGRGAGLGGRHVPGHRGHM